MAKKEFNLGDSLAAVLGSVSDPDQPEQIELIALDLIDEDEKNFYSTEGVEELAANIELFGLLDPVRLRINPDQAGHFLLVSGHRRRLAYLLLRKDNPEKWGRIPSIVEKPAASPELQELRLIFANADTRKLTSADLNHQTERVEMLFYELEKQGFEFPGRMRDHVAEACKISSTKLAVLTAIRNNLIPELKEYYEKNEINESAAYELQKLPVEGQKAIAASCKRTGAQFISGNAAAHCAKYADEYMNLRRCDDGDVCDHHEVRFVQTLRGPSTWEWCFGGCCLKCGRIQDCARPCKKAKAKEKAKKEKNKKEREKRDEDAKIARAKTNEINKLAQQEQAQRILPLIEAAGLTDADSLKTYDWFKTSVSFIRRTAAGEFEDKCYYDGNLIPTSLEGLTNWADALGCTLDFLVGRTEDPTPPAAAPQQTEDTPLQSRSETQDWISTNDALPKQGCEVLILDEDGDVDIDRIGFDGKWYYSSRTPVKFWMPIPPAPGEDWEAPIVEPTSVELPRWQTGAPPRHGRFLCLVDMGTNRLHEQRCDWTGNEWRVYGSTLDNLFTVKAWYPLPDEKLFMADHFDDEKTEAEEGDDE